MVRRPRIPPPTVIAAVLIVLIFSALPTALSSDGTAVKETYAGSTNEADADAPRPCRTEEDHLADTEACPLASLPDAALIQMCTDRGLEIIPFEEAYPAEAGGAGTPADGDGGAAAGGYAHEDYVAAAEQCLGVDREIDSILEEHPELVSQLEEEAVALRQEIGEQLRAPGGSEDAGVPPESGSGGGGAPLVPEGDGAEAEPDGTGGGDVLRQETASGPDAPDGDVEHTSSDGDAGEDSAAAVAGDEHAAKPGLSAGSVLNPANMTLSYFLQEFREQIRSDVEKVVRVLKIFVPSARIRKFVGDKVAALYRVLVPETLRNQIGSRVGAACSKLGNAAGWSHRARDDVAGATVMDADATRTDPEQ